MIDTDEFQADEAALEAATGAVVLARRRLYATRRARILGRVEKADVVRAKLALAAARAELDACRGGAGWWVRRPKRRRRRAAMPRQPGSLQSRGPATTTVVRASIVAYVVSTAIVLLVAQWPMRGPRLTLIPSGHVAHAGDLLLLAATVAAAVAVVKPRP